MVPSAAVHIGFYHPVQTRKPDPGPEILLRLRNPLMSVVRELEYFVSECPGYRYVRPSHHQSSYYCLFSEDWVKLWPNGFLFWRCELPSRYGTLELFQFWILAFLL